MGCFRVMVLKMDGKTTKHDGDYMVLVKDCKILHALSMKAKDSENNFRMDKRA